jgi:serralysin
MPAVVTYSPTDDAYINGVLGDTKWAVNSFTYSFPTSPSYYGSNYAGGEPASQFEALIPTQQAMTRAALRMYASVANLSFAEMTETAARHADLRFAMSDKPSTAWAYFPSTRASGGDAWFNNSSGIYDTPRQGNYAAATFIHEIGHALGLEHAHEAFIMPLDRDSMEYTIMSYRSYVGASATTGYLNETWGYAQTLMMYDIAALQHMYGANFATNSGNTTYAWSPTSGEMFVDGAGQGAPGSNRIFMTLWDAGGSDTYDFSQYTSSLRVNLQPGAWTTTSTAQLAKLHYNGSKTAAGNIANALLHRGDGRSLIENAVGGSGNDTLVGNQTANLLNGGAGLDTLTGSAGDDSLDGGGGGDTATYGGQRSQYEIVQLSDGSVRVSDLRTDTPDGRDLVWHTEWFQFADRTYSAGELATGTTLPVTPSPPVSPPSPPVSPPSPAVAQDRVVAGGSASDRLTGEAGNDLLYGYAGNDVLLGAAGADRLDGGSGRDYASYSGASAGVVADLLSPAVNGGDAQGDTFAGIENLLGSGAADVLRGNNAANVIKGGGGDDLLHGRRGNDALDGGLGSDVVYGQAGRDSLTGGGGRDRFAFNAVGESSGSAVDLIRDFHRGQDRIDLRSIDAKTTLSGNQAFAFIGQAAFDGHAGQLRFAAGLLQGDTNGDRIADFQVKVAGLSVMAKSDFFL